MSEHAVVIVGGGPAGMMLAAELALETDSGSRCPEEFKRRL